MIRTIVLGLVAVGCWTEARPKPSPRTTPVDIVQPVKIEKASAPDDDGEEVGVEGGVVGGMSGDVIGAPPPPPPPPPPPNPSQNVSPTVLEGLRTAGSKLITPDDKTKVAIADSGKDRVVGSFKLCLTDAGEVNSVSTLKSSGFPDYDAKITRTIRTEWRYQPFVINGSAQPVCTAVTFIYTQH